MSEAAPSATGTEDRKVIVAAYACNPLRGSEEAVGWNWVRAISHGRQVTVLTAAYHEGAIRSVCDPEANPRFVFVPHRPWHYRPTPRWQAIEQSIAKPVMNLAYAAWQRDAWRVARELHAAEPFDLAHQLTYVGFRFPGHLWKLGIPFVWGPVGGLENTSWRLLPAMGLGGAIYYGGRNLINSAQRRWLRSPRRAAKAAGPGLIAATGSIADELKARYDADSTVISEVTAPENAAGLRSPPRVPGEKLRVVWSGQLLPGKALNLLLEALALLPRETGLELHILGDGAQRKRWQALAKRLSLDDRCIWHGHLPRSTAMEVMAGAHVLAITSLKDLTSTVVLEGLAFGLPVVCPDHCGFSGAVTPECGIKVAPSSVKALVDGIAAALLRVERDEEARRRMGAAAVMRAGGYSFESLRNGLDEVYRRAEDSARRPAGRR